LLVSEISRLGRKTSEVLKIEEELTDLGVSILVQNYNLETIVKGKRNPMAQLVFTMLAEFARVERETLIERINSGLEEAKRKGKVLGRKIGTSKDDKLFLKEKKKVVELLKQGQSIRNTAKICDIAPGTVQKVKKLLVDN
jgi:DNA invertase Pin-like site-specific DNA recombinase